MGIEFYDSYGNRILTGDLVSLLVDDLAQAVVAVAPDGSKNLVVNNSFLETDENGKVIMPPSLKTTIDRIFTTEKFQGVRWQ